MTYTPIPAGTTDWDVPLNAALSEQDTRITQNAADITTNTNNILTLQSDLDTAEANIATNTANIATNTSNIASNTASISTINTSIATLDWQPQDHGLKAWSQDPAGCGSTGSINTSGVIYLTRVILRNAASISNLYLTITTGGTTLTAGQNLVGLYTSAGSKLVEGADQSGAFTTAGTKTIPITTQNLSAGAYYIAFLTNGTTPPTFMRGNGASASAINIGLASGSGRFLDFGAGQTSLPSSITISSAATNASARWVAMN